MFYANDEQRKLAQASRDRIAGDTGQEVTTEILPLGEFYRAEDYHQKYFLRHSTPLMDDLQGLYVSDREFTDSTLAARLNSYVAGHGYGAVLERELPDYGLGEKAGSLLSGLVDRLDEGTFGAAGCGLVP